MNVGRDRDIHTRTQLISVGPALVLGVLLIALFTHARLQDLKQELNDTGQLIANQLAPAAEYGVISGNTEVLDSLLRATLETPHVRFLEVRDRDENIVVYVERPSVESGMEVDVFHAPIRLQQITLGNDFMIPAQEHAAQEQYLGRVVVGMSDDALSARQQAILAKAVLIGLFALMLTYLLARRLARRLSQPISDMAVAVRQIQAGNYLTPVPDSADGELGELARHLNNLASSLATASRDQRTAMDQLIKTREEAEQANRAKSDFLAMMSHELRTPMNGVLGMLQLMETTEMTAEQNEYTALATESTEHLLKVINDILDFSRIERGALELERIAFNPVELLQGSLQVFQHSAQQRGLYLQLECPDGLEDYEVYGDPTRIRQILVNLLGNALKFTEEGGVSIEVRWQPLDNEVLWFTCAVRDSGIGIDPQRLDSMFDAFQQADTSISRRYGGTGLGLSIARTLAERMGGTLHASSVMGEGSVFTLETPLPFTPRAQLPVMQHAEPGPSGEGQQVLLVEDNPVNQTVIEAMLRSLGYQVTLVADGAQAVHSASQGSFAAILMDCRLPVMDGYEATRQIRCLKAYSGTPIVALTANALQGDREACLQAGMNDYLAKPFKRTDLERLLKRWLGTTPASGMS